MKNTEISWTENFAYATGLFTADGCLMSDGRHLDFTSKDKEQVETFAKCWKLDTPISTKSRGGETIKKYFYVRFSNVNLYRFLESIGLSAKKSLSIGKLYIPKKYFPDFIRGLLDGDGNINICKHPESKLPQLKIRFYSGSKTLLDWVRLTLSEIIGNGSLSQGKRAWALAYGKRDSLKLISYMYYSKNAPALKRKSNIALEYFEINSNFNPNRWQNRFTRV